MPLKSEASRLQALRCPKADCDQGQAHREGGANAKVLCHPTQQGWANQKNHKWWLDKLAISKNIYLTINDKDRNLRGARILFKARQLGESPQPEFCKNVTYVNFSEVLEDIDREFKLNLLVDKNGNFKI
jgi:hypothetical protein